MKDRRSFLRQSALVTGGLFLGQQKILAGFLQQPNFKIRPLRDNISVFTEQGGTIGFLVSRSGVVVVDAEFPDPAKHLIAEIQKQESQPFRWLINTHHHGDHTSGNIAFKGIAEHVLAHANSKQNQQQVAKTKNNEDQQLYPDETYTDTICKQVGREKICLYYYGPGHTNGDSLVHFQHANIVHMGDLMFNRRHPFVDRSAGASIKNWITVLDKAVQQFDRKTIFIFGHAADGYEVTGSADDLKAFRDYLGNVLKYTEAGITAGKGRDEVIKGTSSIPGSPEWKGDGIDRPLTAAYDELTAGL